MENTELILPPLPEASNLNTKPPMENPARQIGTEVAHDLNNLFTIIGGFADRLLYEHGTNTALRPDLQVVLDCVRRAERVVRSAAKINSASVPVAA